MKSTNKNLKAAVLMGLLTITTSLPAFAHRVGNGGDHVRATFLQMGQAVIDYLQQTQEGAALVTNQKLKILDLQDTLDINKVAVSDDVLRDNSGSIVEALGIPDSIILQKSSWFSHFEKSTDIYYLVFHEMLRSAGVNDDNYIISKALLPFPSQRKIAAKVTPLIPLIEDDNISSLFDLAKVAVNGSGCPLQLSGTQTSFDSESNVLEITTRQYRNESSGTRVLARRSCSMAIPVKLPAKKRLVISQIDLRGKVDLQPKSQVQISFEAFLAGQSNSVKTKVIKSTQPNLGVNGTFQMRRTDLMKSNCGGNDIVRLNSSILSDLQGSGNANLKPEFSEVNSIQVFLTLEDCP